MRILHTADWHLGRSLEGNSRLSEQEEFIEELCEIVSNEDIDLILIAGDIFDSVNPPAKAEELFYYAIERLSNNGQRTVVGIAGNHDNPERLCAANPLAIHQGVYLLGMPADIPAQSRYGKHRLIDRDISYLSYFSEKRNELVKLFALPYPSEMRLNELLTKFPMNKFL